MPILVCTGTPNDMAWTWTDGKIIAPTTSTTLFPKISSRRAAPSGQKVRRRKLADLLR